MRTISRWLSAILFSTLLFAAQDLSGQGWVYRPTLSAALHTAITLDSQGRAHIAFSELYRAPGGESIIVIHYGVWQGDHFEYAQVDSGGFNDYVSIALDKQEYPHIVHHSHVDWGLRHHYWDGNMWNTEIIDHLPLDQFGFGGHEGWSNSITFDENNLGHISHIDFPSGGIGAEGDSKGIIHISHDGAEWTSDVVGSNPTWVFDGTSIAVNSQNKPAIAYYDSLTKNLMLAQRIPPSGFGLTEVDTADDVGQYSNLEFDENDNPRIGYFKRLGIEHGIIRIASFDGSGWIIQDVDTIYNMPTSDGHRSQHMIDLEIGSDGLSHIAYTGEDSLYYAKVRASTVEKKLVADYSSADSSLEGNVWLDLDISDIPHMTYSVAVATPGIPVGYYVTEQTESPVVSGIPDQTISSGETFARINLDNYVADPDNGDSVMTWEFSGNVDLNVVYRSSLQAVKVKYPPGWVGSEEIVFTARDPQGNTGSDTASFTLVATGISESGESFLGEQATVPSEPFLGENYPNPFNPSTTISYGLSEDGRVSIKVYNLIGQEVATLVDDYQKAGFRTVVWNGTDNAGISVASGIYLYRMTLRNLVETKKLLLLK